MAKIKIASNRSGMSLMGTMAAVAITSIVIYVTITAINYSLNNQRTVEVRLATIELHQEIINILRAQSVCSYNYGEKSKNAATFDYHPIYEPLNASDFNQPTESVEVPHISTKKGSANDGTDNVYRYVKYGHVIGAATYQEVYGGNKVKITEMRLANFQPTGPGNPTEGTADLQLSLEAVGPIVGVRNFLRQVTIRIILEANYDPTIGAVNTVKSCMAVGGSGEDTVWIKNPGGEIYYSGGNVGVGTSDPSEDFEVGPIASGTPMATLGIKSVSPALRLFDNDVSLPADSSKFQIQNAQGNLHFGPVVDADSSWKLSTVTELSVDPIYGSMVLLNSGDSFFKGDMNIGNKLTNPSLQNLTIAQGNRAVVGTEVVNMGGVEPSYASQTLRTYSTTGHSGLNFRRARGTYSAAQTVLSGDLLGAISAWGWDGDNWGLIGGWSPVAVGFWADGDFSAVNTPTRISFITSSGNDVRERMIIDRYGRVILNADIPEVSHATGRMAGLIVQDEGGWGGGIASKVAGAEPNGLGPRYFGYSMNGTLAAATATVAGENLVTIGGLGHTGGGAGSEFTANANGFIEIEADGNFSTTSTPTRINFMTTPVSAVDALDRMTIRNNGRVGINVADPAQILHVNGVIRVDAPGDATIQLNSTAGTAGGPGFFWEMYEEDSGGNFAICYYDLGGCNQKLMLQTDGDLIITGVYSPSDQRLKENIVKVENPLEVLSRINGVRFQWKQSKRNSVGVIAQDVEAVLPELVETDDKGFKTMNYLGMIGPIIEGIKELANRLTEISNEIAKTIANIKILFSEVEQIKTEMASLKNQVSELKQENEKLRRGMSKVSKFESDDNH